MKVLDQFVERREFDELVNFKLQSRNYSHGQKGESYSLFREISPLGGRSKSHPRHFQHRSGRTPVEGHHFDFLKTFPFSKSHTYWNPDSTRLHISYRAIRSCCSD